MKYCKRVGIDLTKKCQAKCKTCFYRFKEDFNSDYHKPLDDVKKEIEIGVQGGCNHAVMVGWGEPTLYKDIKELIKWCTDNNINTSIISNGLSALSIYKELYEIGLNHLHLSVHGIKETFNKILEVPNAWNRMEKLLQWLKENHLSWRSNTTLQQLNYKEIPDIVQKCVDYGVWHYVFLGFLTHYEWVNKMGEVAVSSEILQPYIESGIKILEENNILMTVRYHPMCLLHQDYWKYVTNARYVAYDPYEWSYNNVFPNANEEIKWNNALNIGNAVSRKEEPCITCKLNLHCGGYDNRFIKSMNVPIKSIIDIPDDYKSIIDVRGGLFDLNPINNYDGNIL